MADAQRRSARRKRQGDAKPTALIGLEGLQGKPVADSCNAHQISPSPYDQGRDQCLANAAHAVERHQHTRQEARLEHEDARRTPRVGELTWERKNSAELLA